MIDRRGFLQSLAPAAAWLAAWRSSSTSRLEFPAEVLIIRHAEEPKDGPHLNARGLERAEALPRLFQKRFAKPTSLFAAKRSRASERSFETIQPLSRAIGVPIDERYQATGAGALAAALRTARYAGAHVLVCWHREYMPDLAAALGVSKPPSCPSHQYDHIWRITQSGGAVRCEDQGQQLLKGDGVGDKTSGSFIAAFPNK